MVTAAPSLSAALVLDLEPGLGARIDHDAYEQARHACRGTVLALPAGRWPVPSALTERGELAGILVSEGVVCREISLRDRSLIELLGSGDVFLPPVGPSAGRLGGPVTITMVTDVRLLVLGRSFLAASARWPGLLTELHRRLELQRERVAVQGLFVHLPRAEHRLLLALRHLANRWGFDGPDGTVIPLALTHDILGLLAAARRPTVTQAIRVLESDGLVHRLDDGGWLLTPAGVRMVDALTRSPRSARPIGESLRLRQTLLKVRSESRALRAEAAQLRQQRNRLRGS